MPPLFQTVAELRSFLLDHHLVRQAPINLAQRNPFPIGDFDSAELLLHRLAQLDDQLSPGLKVLTERQCRYLQDGLIDDYIDISELLIEDLPRRFQYAIREKLGKGGQGQVFLCTDHSGGVANDPRVAIKLILVTDDHELTRLKREIETLKNRGQFESIPNFVRSFRCPARMFAVVMEYVPGPTLTQHIQAQMGQVSRGLPCEEVITIALSLCRGMKELHDAGFVHRDLKPDNIIRHAKRNNWVIVDQGFTTYPHAQQASSQSFLFGTPGYFDRTAYERSITPSNGPPLFDVDIFALGCIFNYLLTGEAPHYPYWNLQGRDAFPFVTERFEAMQPASVRADTPTGLHELILDCVTYSRHAHRPAHVDQLIDRLIRIGHSSSPMAQVSQDLSKLAFDYRKEVERLSNSLLSEGRRIGAMAVARDSQQRFTRLANKFARDSAGHQHPALPEVGKALADLINSFAQVTAATDWKNEWDSNLLPCLAERILIPLLSIQLG